MNLNTQRSLYTTQSVRKSINCSKSNYECGECYKQNEIEILVKNIHAANEDLNDHKNLSLTNSKLDTLEKNLCIGTSKEPQTENSNYGIESHMKLFQSTVLEIFDHFNDSMRDFEMLKMKFNELITKKQDSIVEMENFIKEIIKHIKSSDSFVTYLVENNKDNTNSISEIVNSSINAASASLLSISDAVLESYKNNDYSTKSTSIDCPVTGNHEVKIGETLDVALMSNNSNMRNLNVKHLSDMKLLSNNIINKTKGLTASAEDLHKSIIKKKELECYFFEQQYDFNSNFDKEIPVKLSSGKKNIHFDDQCSINEELNSGDKSFIHKFCHYLCRKLRRGS